MPIMAPNLLLVSTIGAGHDTVDLKACTRARVLAVSKSGGGNAQAVAEHTLAMMPGLAKRLPGAAARMRRAPGIVRGNYIGRNTAGRTLGIVGFGHVGRRLATLCLAALGMRVLVCDAHRAPHEVAAAGCEPVSLEGGMQARPLNPDAWPRYCERFASIMGRAPHGQA